MYIRQYEQKDLGEVIALWTECGLVVPQNDPAKDIARKLKVDRDLFLVGIDRQALIATVMGGYEGHRGWINYLAVKPSERRKGYGQEMMRAVEIRIEDKGCAKINLQVRGSNTEIVAFYTAMGYGLEDIVSLGKRLEVD